MQRAALSVRPQKDDLVPRPKLCARALGEELEKLLHYLQEVCKMTEYTKGLAEFITKLEYKDLTPEQVEKAKMLTLHVAGFHRSLPYHTPYRPDPPARCQADAYRTYSENNT